MEVKINFYFSHCYFLRVSVKFVVLIVFFLKPFTRPCWWLIILHPTTPFENVASLSRLYRYFYGKSSVELHSLVPTDQTFISKTHYTTYAKTILPHFLREKEDQLRYSREPLIRGTYSLKNSSTATKVDPRAILPKYPHNLHLHAPLAPIQRPDPTFNPNPLTYLGTLRFRILERFSKKISTKTPPPRQKKSNNKYLFSLSSVKHEKQ